MPDDRPPIGLAVHVVEAKAGSEVSHDAPTAFPLLDEPQEEQASRNASFHPGARVADKYVVERLIGEGGLGVVVAARHVHLDQTVAIKYLRPKALGSKAVAERFLREARLAAKIRSEHVVHVYDVGTLPDGAPYMVMEYLAGTDLGRQLNASGPLPVDRAIDYVLQACEALAEAHVAGIVHRDIKPDNLFIATSPGGKTILKILDFGISKMSARKTESNQELTEAGDKFGTPVYMSPEQLLSSTNVDARADVWALGVVLYELLTGKLPFDGDSLPELCTAILNKPPVPLAQVRPYLPDRLQSVIDACLAKDVESRYQNVAELAQDLLPIGGPQLQPRVDHVLHVLLGAGERVRPATPMPDGSGARALREASTLAETADRATTGSGTWGPALARATGGNRKAWYAAAAGAILVAGIGIFTIAGSSERAPATGASPSAPVVVAPPPAATVPVQTPRAPVTPPAPSPGASADTSSGAAVDPIASADRGKPSPSLRSVGAAKKAAKSHAAPADPNAVINPFE